MAGIEIGSAYVAALENAKRVTTAEITNILNDSRSVNASFHGVVNEIPSKYAGTKAEATAIHEEFEAQFVTLLKWHRQIEQALRQLDVALKGSDEDMTRMLRGI